MQGYSTGVQHQKQYGSEMCTVWDLKETWWVGKGITSNMISTQKSRYINGKFC